MTWTFTGARGIANSAVSGTTVSVTPTSNFTVGSVAIVGYVGDNIGITGGSGISREVTVTDTGGQNRWIKLGEVRNADAAGAGLTIAAWMCVVVSLTTGHTVTVTASSAIVAKGIHLEEFAIGANMKPWVVGGLGTTQDATTTPTVTTNPAVGPTTSRLWYGLLGREGDGDETFTQDGSFTNLATAGKFGTTTLATDVNASGGAGYKISSSDTTETYNPTIGTARDVCTALWALDEVASPAAYETAVLSRSGIRAYWPLGELVGDWAIDYAGQNPAKYTSTGGTHTYGTTRLLHVNSGTQGAHLLTRGSAALGPYLQVPYHTDLTVGNGPYALETWFALGATADQETSFLDKATGSYALTYDPVAAKLRVRKSFTQTLVSETGQTPATDTSTHHVVGTKSATQTYGPYTFDTVITPWVIHDSGFGSSGTVVGAAMRLHCVGGSYDGFVRATQGAISMTNGAMSGRIMFPSLNLKGPSWVLRNRGDYPGLHWGYHLGLDIAAGSPLPNTLHIGVKNGNNTSNNPSGEWTVIKQTPFTPSAGVNYYWRFEVVGTAIRGYFGATPFAGTWSLTTSDSVLTLAGSVEVFNGDHGFLSNTSDIDFDDIFVESYDVSSSVLYKDAANVSGTVTDATIVDNVEDLLLGARQGTGVASGGYTAEVLADSPTLFWKLDEAAGNFADSSGHGHTGVAAGGITYSQTGPGAGLPTGVKFNGSTGKVTLADTSDLNVGDGPFSFEFWYKRSTSGVTEVLAAKSTDTVDAGYEIYFTSGNLLRLADGNGTVNISTLDPVSDTNWHHFVLTRGAGVDGKAYLDGFEDHAAGNVIPFTDSSTEFSLAEVASAAWGSGTMAGAAVYKGVQLSGARVAAHYAAVNTASGSGVPGTPSEFTTMTLQSMALYASALTSTNVTEQNAIGVGTSAGGGGTGVWTGASGASAWTIIIAAFGTTAVPGVWIDWGLDGFGVGGAPSPDASLARMLPENVSGLIDNITSDVISFTWSRGAPADHVGGSQPGRATIVVKNTAGKYSPDNAASPLVQYLRPGRPVWIGAAGDGTLSGAAAYGVFAGYVREISPIVIPGSSPMAEILCEDALSAYSRRSVKVAAATTYSHGTLRTAILDAIGEDTNRRDLDEEGGTIPLAAADSVNGLSVLDELNGATGTRHFIEPQDNKEAWFKYRTLNRQYNTAAAASETWNADDITDISGWRVTEETVVNRQEVAVTPLDFPIGLSEVWRSGEVPFAMTPAQNKVIWATFEDFVKDAVITVNTSAGTAAGVLTNFGTTAKIDLHATTAATISDIIISGKLVARRQSQLVVAEDPASQSEYGIRSGASITSSYAGQPGLAQGLADFYISKFRNPLRRPTVTRTSEFPSILEREIGDIVNLTVDQLYLTLKRMEIIGITGRCDRAASATVRDWSVTYELQEAPGSGALFTLESSLLDGPDILGS